MRFINVLLTYLLTKQDFIWQSQHHFLAILSQKLTTSIQNIHHLHYHRLHLLLLAQYFILNSRLGSSANPFLLRPFPFLPD